jgi:hypothetical protein
VIDLDDDDDDDEEGGCWLWKSSASHFVTYLDDEMCRKLYYRTNKHHTSEYKSSVANDVDDEDDDDADSVPASYCQYRSILFEFVAHGRR